MVMATAMAIVAKDLNTIGKYQTHLTEMAINLDLIPLEIMVHVWVCVCVWEGDGVVFSLSFSGYHP